MTRDHITVTVKVLEGGAATAEENVVTLYEALKKIDGDKAFQMTLANLPVELVTYGRMTEEQVKAQGRAVGEAVVYRAQMNELRNFICENFPGVYDEHMVPTKVAIKLLKSVVDAMPTIIKMFNQVAHPLASYFKRIGLLDDADVKP